MPRKGRLFKVSLVGDDESMAAFRKILNFQNIA